MAHRWRILLGIQSKWLQVCPLDDELALLVLLTFFVGFQLSGRYFCQKPSNCELTYVSPPDDDRTLDAVDVSDNVPASHHFLLGLGAQEYVDPMHQKGDK